MIWLLIGYMFLFIHRPFEVWPALGTFHIERLYMLGTLLFALGWPRKKWIPSRMHYAFGALAVAVLVCWMASPWASNPDSERVVEDYFKIFVFFALVILVVHDEKDLKTLLKGFLVVMAVYLTHSLWEYKNGRHSYQMMVYRMIGVDTTMGDANSFGGTIVYVLPFVVPFWMDPPSRCWRWFVAGYVALSLVCVGLTGSRSAFVGVILAALVTVLRSKYRVRLGLLLAMISPLLFFALPDSLQNRFETIIDPSVGPKNADVSARGRIDGFWDGVRLWNDNPFTGCGPGAWRPATGSHIESHNLYGQVMGELGSLGILAMLAVLLAFWLNLRWIRKVYKQHPEWGHDFLYRVAQAVGLGVLLLLFEGNFSHNLYRYHWVWFGGFLIITRYCVQQRLNAEAAVVEAWNGFDHAGVPAPGPLAYSQRRVPV
jgi:O-antigen ligase